MIQHATVRFNSPDDGLPSECASCFWYHMDFRPATPEQVVKLKPLVEANPKKINERIMEQEVPLHWAITKSRWDLVEWLISNGADVNARDRSKGSPLIRAVLARKQEMVELFLKHGADVKARNKEGETPLAGAKKKNQTRIVELLLQRTDTK